MRIAILTSAHPVLDVRVFHKEAISLSAGGYEVTLIGPLDIAAQEPLKAAGIIYHPLLPRGGRAARLLQWVRILQALRHSDFDVWHFHDPELLPLAIFARALFRKRTQLVYDVHEDVPKDILDKPWIPLRLRKPISTLADRIEGWGIKRCDLIVAATDSIAEHVRRSSDRVVIVHNYPKIFSERDPLSRSSNPVVQIIYAGNITPIRGLREVVQAMEAVRDMDVFLHLVGQLYPNDFEQEIRAHAGPNVKIYGKVTFEEAQTSMERCDIGIVTFHPLPNHIEAMPNKLFEYMQCGLAVIASNFPLWKSIIEKSGCGVTVNPLSSEEIARAIRKLASDPERRHRMGEAGRQMVCQEYSWQHEEQLLLQAYRRLKC